MKVEVHDFHTEVFLSKNEVLELCKPGEGNNTCIWLVVGPKGLECTYLNKPISLLERWKKGLTNAKRDGCEKVKSVSI